MLTFWGFWIYLRLQHLYLVFVCVRAFPAFAAANGRAAVRLCDGVYLWLQDQRQAAIHPHDPRGADAGRRYVRLCVNVRLVVGWLVGF